MEDVVLVADHTNYAATLMGVYARGWTVVEKVIVGFREVRKTKRTKEISYVYHIIVRRPALPPPSIN
jgi:hypothetical protein